jgi:tricorn protease
MSQVGYYRHATLAGNTIAFVCEDDLWSWTQGDRAARRLTVGSSEITTPRFSPDGNRLAFVCADEGHPEVYVMDALGSRPERITFLGGEVTLLSGWSSDGSTLQFANDAHAPFTRDAAAYEVSASGGVPNALKLGSLYNFARSDAGTVVGRNAVDPARWKRYRGGTAGDLWVDAGNTGTFKRLITLAGNLVWPMWIAGRIYFLSDHEGIGNIYSVMPTGGDLQRHTHEREYYVRFPSTDGTRISYTVAGAIKILHPATGQIEEPEILAPSSSPQLARRFVDAADMLADFSPSPNGERVALVSRGVLFTMPLWEEAVIRQAGKPGIRTRAAVWLHDAKRLAYVSDEPGFEQIELRSIDGGEPTVITTEQIGRVTEMIASPTADILACANHRNELLLIDVAEKSVTVLDRSPAARINDLSFSPDGRYLAYASSIAIPPAQANSDTSVIRIADLETKEVRTVTSLLRTDRSPVWDPEGKYLFFISNRDFNPIYDAQQFDLSFPQASRPYAITLRKDVPSPFVRQASPVYKEDKDEKDDEKDELESDAPNEKDEKAEEKPKPIVIEFDGIEGRIIGFPVPEANIGELVAVRKRVLFTTLPVHGISQTAPHDSDEHGGTLHAYDFETLRIGTVAQNVHEIVLGGDRRTLAYRSNDNIRVIDATTEMHDDHEPDEDNPTPGRKSGWLDLNRIAVEVHPNAEWTQMYHEAWRLQREQFWTEDMSGVDWDIVRERYARILPRLRTRTELSDLIWEMQGELGTSHAYEMGGDHRTPPNYRRGFLGARIALVEGRYQVAEILRGDSWNRTSDSPLAQPGIDVSPGDFIAAVGGRQLSASFSLDQALVHTADQEVTLTIARGDATHHVVVKTLRSERPLRYRAWVEKNRAFVHERTGGRVGYLHIPDMGPWGFSEFHRGYLSEFNRDGLIVDVRHNRGGHVSPLLLEKLARKRVGYDVSRYGVPIPYPPESVGGPMVGLTDQFAGSDGDIFSHCFKLYGLGPLVGKRTWGGVIGINPYHELIDGTMTTQPEFSFWFADVGWNVENYGTAPDHDIDIAPHDVKMGVDPQMEKALVLIDEALKSHPPTPPPFTARPNLKLP